MIKGRFAIWASWSVVVFIVGLLAGCEGNKEVAPPEGVRPVKIVTVEEADERQLNRYPAVIDAAVTTGLNFPISGLLQELHVSEAQRVAEGDLLALLDQEDAVSRLNAAKAQYELAEQEYQRALRLKAENAIAQREFDQRESQRDTARANLNTAEKAFRDTELRAPYGGIISKVPVRRLQNVQTGTMIATLIDTSSWEALINLPAQLVATTPLRRDEGAYISFSVMPDLEFPAVFKSATLEADALSQTYAVTFAFEPPDNLLLLPGMNAHVTFRSSLKKTSDGLDVVVPLAAIVSDGQQQYVWIVDPEQMTVRRQAVSVKPGIGDALIITDGLQVGAQIVAAGAAYLSDGMKVRRWSE